MEMVDWAERGNLPVPGGVLSQANVFLETVRFVRREENQLAAARTRQP